MVNRYAGCKRNEEKRMSEKAILITGVCGEIGQALLESFAEQNEQTIVTFD